MVLVKGSSSATVKAPIRSRGSPRAVSKVPISRVAIQSVVLMEYLVRVSKLAHLCIVRAESGGVLKVSSS
jgi:hypothetical protein